jgi:murein DD-endopeptidase MepM/ murein hydrolase activator NlpD
MQGAFGALTHMGTYAWDLGLPEGSPVVAAAQGRVIWVIDARTKTGFNDFNESNHIFIDQGNGRFATYTHHGTGTARVRPGQFVPAGTRLAEVGKIGTVQPHIHFDVRGPSWHQTHDVRFKTSGGGEVEAHQGLRYLSGTWPDTAGPDDFHDSTLTGEEFAANGIAFAGGGRAFRLPVEKPFVIKGRVLRQAQLVGFYLWRDARPSEYAATAVPDSDGSFVLRVRIPRASQGPRWYRITILGADGRYPEVATLPAMVE